MTFRGRPLSRIRTPAGEIAYAFELEEIFAAEWSHTPWPMYLAMDPDEQAKVVAAYQVKKKLDAVVEQDAKRKGFWQRFAQKGK